MKASLQATIHHKKFKNFNELSLKSLLRTRIIMCYTLKPVKHGFIFKHNSSQNKKHQLHHHKHNAQNQHVTETHHVQEEQITLYRILRMC